jgi:excinuclease ABC subunit C
MVRQVKDFDYYVCDTEIEALSLENTLIKQYSPKYNIRLKDAKSYPYIKITEGEYPRLVMTRKREADGAKYFGPYSGTSTVFSVINTLSAILGLPTCSRRFPRDIGRERPCMYYQINRCCGVCAGGVPVEEYAEKIRYAADILRGNTAQVKREISEKMYALAEEEKYEAAAKQRDILAALDELGEGYMTDTTNADLSLDRNYLRGEILPRLERLRPDPEAALTRLSSNLREELAVQKNAHWLQWWKDATSPHASFYRKHHPAH